MHIWNKPIYKLKAINGKYISIDVTTSCCPALPPNKVIWEVAKFLKERKVNSILDFGAGSLRHTFPLLACGFQVCAVEFIEQFQRNVCHLALQIAKKSPNFSALIFPEEFIKNRRKFDAAILAFVVPTMPRDNERKKLLKLLRRKLESNSYIFWMSQYGKYGPVVGAANRVKDGWYLHPERKNHSFYTEFRNTEIDDMFKKIGFNRLRVFSQRGSDQFRLYFRGRFP